MQEVQRQSEQAELAGFEPTHDMWLLLTLAETQQEHVAHDHNTSIKSELS